MGASYSSPVPPDGGTISIVWLDASVNDTEQNLNAQELLRSSFNSLKTFTDQSKCENTIRSTLERNRIILIVGGRLGQQIVPRVHDLKQISSILVYCMDKRYEEWTKGFNKVKHVTEELDELVARILSMSESKLNNSSTNNRLKEPFSINTFDPNINSEQSTSNINGQFLHSQLLNDCLLEMRSLPSDKPEFVIFCKKKYSNNTIYLKTIQEFETDYLPDRALHWYTKDCIIYRELNNALRTQNIDLLYLFGFFIRDLCRQIDQNRYTSPIRVFRGQWMSSEELRRLKSGPGQLISMNSFVSTSLNRESALSFLGDPQASNGDLKPVLFDINVDPRRSGTKSFAYIARFSSMPDENEVLMMCGSVFRLNYIEQSDGVWIIGMVLCSDNDHDVKGIFETIKREYHRDGQTHEGSFGLLLTRMGKFDEAERYIHRLLKGLSDNDRNIPICYENLGQIAMQRGNYNLSLDLFRKALELQMRALRPNSSFLARIYTTIGDVYLLKSEQQLALEAFNKAKAINGGISDDDQREIASHYSNMGNVYLVNKDASKALDSFQKVLETKEKYLPEYHYELGEAHYSIACAHGMLRHVDQALNHFHQSLRIYEKSLPPSHNNIGIAYDGIGSTYLNQTNYKQAVVFLEKAAAILRHNLPTNHPDVLKVERNLQLARDRLK